MPRQPIGTTFVVSMSLLGLIAAIQVTAVVLRYADVAAQILKDKATAPNDEVATNVDPQGTPFRPTTQAPIQPAQPAPQANGQQIKALLAEADKQFRLGDFEASLKTLDKVEALSPGDPSVLLIKAAVLEKIDQSAEAVVLYEQVLRYPGLPPDQRAYAKKKIDMLAESLGSSPAIPRNNPLTTKEIPDDGGASLTDPTGIPAGATLGIIDIRNKDIKRGKKTLSVSVKSLPKADIASDKVKILAYFYEETEDGDTVLTESHINSQWMSPPIDWAENEPEILDLEYTLPEAAGAEGRKYRGYVVGLYYNGELQAYRADPAVLLKKFPLPLDDPQ